jgi:hypothetical protein
VNRLLQITHFWTAANNSTFWLSASLGDPKRSIPQPDNIRLSSSIQALKYSLKSNISSIPFYYYTGSRLGQILHSRLRMQCSSLNQHLYRKNIVDSPNCICGSKWGSCTDDRKSRSIACVIIVYICKCLRY